MNEITHNHSSDINELTIQSLNLSNRVNPSQKSLENRTEELRENIHSPSLDTPPSSLPKKVTFFLQMSEKFQGFKKLWNRYLAVIPLERINQADEIQTHIFNLHQQIHKHNYCWQKMKFAEMRLLEKYPSELTISMNERHLNYIEKTLNEAKLTLEQLNRMQSTVEELVDNHSAYDSIPAEIKKIKETIEHLDAKLKLAHDLATLEKSMSKYPYGSKRTFRASWNTFEGVQNNYKELFRPFWKEISPNFHFDTQMNYHLQAHIKQTYPDLSLLSERLLNFMKKIHFEQIDDLKAQTKYLNSQFSKYKKEAETINNLEKHIASDSIFERVYRIFIPLEKLQAQLEATKLKNKKTYEQIKHFEKFEEDKLDWLNNLGQNNRECRILYKNIVFTMSSIGYFDDQERMVELMDQVNSVLNEDNGSKDSEVTAKLDELTQMLVGIDFKRSSLPGNFHNLSPLQQFKAFMHVARPTLRQKVDNLVKLLEQKEKTHLYPVNSIHERGINEPALVAQPVNQQRVTPVLTTPVVKIEKPIPAFIAEPAPSPKPIESLPGIPIIPQLKSENLKESNLPLPAIPKKLKNIHPAFPPPPIPQTPQTQSQPTKTDLSENISYLENGLYSRRETHQMNKKQQQPLNKDPIDRPVDMEQGPSMEAPPMDAPPPPPPLETPPLTTTETTQSSSNPDLLTAIKGKKLKTPTQPLNNSQTPPDNEQLLIQIRNGKKLNKVKDNPTLLTSKQGPKNLRTFDELMALIRKEELTYDQISKEELEKLQPMQRSQLELTKRAQFTESQPDSEDDETDNEDWD